MVLTGLHLHTVIIHITFYCSVALLGANTTLINQTSIHRNMQNFKIFNLIRQFVTHLYIFHSPYVTSSISWTCNPSGFLKDQCMFRENKEWLWTFRCFVFLFVVVASVYIRELENVRYGCSEWKLIFYFKSKLWTWGLSINLLFH